MSDLRTQEQKEASYLEGEQAEQLVIDAINVAENSTLKCEPSGDSPFWTPYVDSVLGDIYMRYENSDGKTLIKRIDVKKNGWVTLQSANAFGNCDDHYYVIWNGSVENSWVISAATTKVLIRKLEGSAWIKECPRSKKPSINLNDYDRKNELRKKISLTKFIAAIDS